MSSSVQGRCKQRGRRHERPVFLTKSLYINGHKINVGLENGFWDAVTEIAAAEGSNVSRLISMVADRPQRKNFSSTIRLFVLNYYRSRRNGEDKANRVSNRGQNRPASLR